MKAVKVTLVLLLILLSVNAFFGQDNSGQNSSPANDLKVSLRDDKSNNERYRIGYQDTLQITVFRHPELSRSVSVNPNGTILLPRVEKPLVAVCKTEQELADIIAAEYKKNILRDPFVDVRAVEQKSQAFGVIGAVEKPGYFYINRKYHLLEMLAFAGGPNKEAGSRMLVARPGSASFCQQDLSAKDEEKELQVFDFKIREVQEGKVNFWMQPGDIITVLEADYVYIVGNVNKPGRIALRNPITLSQAIATAEGFKPASKKDSVVILREKPGSKDREQLVFNINDIQKLKADDPVLQINDIVAVSEDKGKKIFRDVFQSLTGGLGSLPVLLP